MKTILLIMPMILFQGISAQTLSFDYDSGGNQKIRQYCSNCAFSRMANKDQPTLIQAVKAPVFEVKIYPNPTKDRVHLVWEPELGVMIKKVEYVAYNFTQFRELAYDKRENKATLDLSDQPIGMYVVVFHLTNGEKLTYKILKQ